MGAPREIATDHVRRGWCVIPLPHGKKRQVKPGWLELRITEYDVESYFNETSGNTGVRLGEAHCELVDIDLHCAEAC